MDAGLDTGPVYAERRIAIAPDDDAETLHDKLAVLGAELLLTVLADIEAGRARASAQSNAGATYAKKIEKAETVLRWERSAAELERAVRAFHPAVARLGNDAFRVWRARVVSGTGEPGTVISENLHVACGAGALAIEELQPPGGRRMSTAEFLRGRRLPPGTRFS